MSEGLAPVLENPDYFEVMAATVTVRATKPRTSTRTGFPAWLLPDRKREWSGTFREDVVVQESFYGDEDYLVMYREDGFDDPYEPADWDWTLAVEENGSMWFDYGDPYHTNWEPQAVEVTTDA